MDSSTIKEISILPHRSLMPKIGQTGYSVSEALSELVDNSIDAREQDHVLVVEIRLKAHEGVIEVVDNGVGMDEITASNSIRLAFSDKKNMLGEFGLGLKTAATCLGKEFQIITSQSNSEHEYVIEYDEQKWLESGDWNKHPMKIFKKVVLHDQGTTIRIKKLNFKIYPNLPGNIRKELSTRFAPFIENKEVIIKVNTKFCEPEPLLLKTDFYPPDGKQPFNIKLESGNEVVGWRGMLQKGSEKGEYGFRVFRRDRLIKQYAKIGFTAHPEARQIIGELHLNHIPVTHNKREFIEESPLYQELIKEGGIFWNFMRDLVREARSTVRKTQINQGILDKMEIQKENIMKAIKHIPQLREYAFPESTEYAKGTSENNEGKDTLEVEKRDREDIVTIEETTPPVTVGTRSPNKTHIRKTYYITIHGKKFKVEHKFEDLQNDDILKDKHVDNESGILVITNIGFPGFASTKDHVFYGVWNIAEAIAEVMVEMNDKSQSEIFKIRDLILMKSQQLSLELDDLEQDRKKTDTLKREYEKVLQRLKEKEEKIIN